MADPVKTPNQQQPQILEKKDYGSGVSTQTQFETPTYQAVQPTQIQQPTQAQPPQVQQPQQGQQPPQVQTPQVQTPQFRQGAKGAKDATSRFLAFAKANVGAGTQRMQQGIQQNLQNQFQQSQQNIQNLGAQDVQKGLNIAQNAATLAGQTNTQQGFQNLIQGGLGTRSGARAGIENQLLRYTPGAMTNIQQTAQQGMKDVLGTTNQYLGGFKTKVMQDGKELESIQNYDQLNPEQFGAGQVRSEADIARGGYSPEEDQFEYVTEEEGGDVGGEPQAQGLLKTIGKQNWMGKDLKAGLQTGADYLNKKTGIDVGGMTNVSQPGQMAKSIAMAPLAANTAVLNTIKAAAGKRAADVASKASEKAKAAASKVLGGVGGGVKKLFCHAAGTLVIMADGSFKPIEQINTGDIVMWGGEVLAIGSKLASDTYRYNETTVTGLHAVYEDNQWIRVQDSDKAEYLGEAHEVFPIVTETHFVITADGTVWRDYEELDNSEHLTDEEILAIMNNG